MPGRRDSRSPRGRQLCVSESVGRRERWPSTRGSRGSKNPSVYRIEVFGTVLSNDVTAVILLPRVRLINPHNNRNGNASQDGKT